MAVAKVKKIPVIKGDGKSGTLTTITDIDPTKWKLVKKGVFWTKFEFWFWLIFAVWTYFLGEPSLFRLGIWVCLYFLINSDILKGAMRVVLYSAAIIFIASYFYSHKPEGKSFYQFNVYRYQISVEKVQ
jgi:hypothetical protein